MEGNKALTTYNTFVINPEYADFTNNYSTPTTKHKSRKGDEF